MKNQAVFVCSACGSQSSKWYGKCPACSEWNTIAEEAVVLPKPKSSAKTQYTAPLPLSKINADDTLRIPTEIGEFDTVLGGGLVPGSLILVGGEPGIGKSTLLLQVCQSLCQKGRLLYVSGEESGNQLKIRANRLGIDSDELYIAAQTNADSIAEYVASIKPSFMIVDSIQTMYSPELTGTPGSVSQVRAVTLMLMQLAKQTDVTVFIVGHVTKEGGIAGPKVLEHMVDCVLYFEGDRHQNYRILRTVKNRFGRSGEIGVFEMSDGGLKEVLNPSLALLEGRPHETAGSAVICAMEGSRPLLAEIQALVSPTRFGMPRRTTDGIDYNRAVLLMAVLEKRVGMNLSDQDAFVNVIGGINVNEPASDLGICLAIASGFRNFAVPTDMVAAGEVGLTGELRSIGSIDRRISEAAKLGFRRILIPASNAKMLDKKAFDIEIIGVSTLIEALAIVR